MLTPIQLVHALGDTRLYDSGARVHLLGTDELAMTGGEYQVAANHKRLAVERFGLFDELSHVFLPHSRAIDLLRYPLGAEGALASLVVLHDPTVMFGTDLIQDGAKPEPSDAAESRDSVSLSVEAQVRNDQIRDCLAGSR